MRVAIVGAGFSGIAAAIALLRDGVEDVVLFEAADDFGGTWHFNTYPGIACDVPSYLYCFSFAQRTDWERPCPPGEEIQRYLHEVAAQFGVSPRIRCSTPIASAAFDEARASWTLQTAAGDEHVADAVVVAAGQLSRPNWPVIDGMEAFAGHSFHSARWDHGHDLTGRRVAVVGTGASAVQFVPEIADAVEHLDVYQRTGNWFMPRWNSPYPRPVRAFFNRVPGAQAARRAAFYWYMESIVLGLIRVAPVARATRLLSAASMRWQLRHDAEVRRKVWPDYPIGCKRILFSSYFLPVLQRPDVEVVTDRIERVTERGIVAGGVERPVDTIIWGTGFRSHDFVLPMQVRGRDGRELQEAWHDGARAHLGLAVSGFPNLFLMYGPNTNLGVGSIIVMIEAQARYVASALRRSRAVRAALDVLPEVQARSTAAVQERLDGSVWARCRSWYRDAATGRIVNNWPGFMTEYVRATRALDPAEYAEVRAQHAEIAA